MKTIRIAVEAKQTVPLTQLVPFQEDIKTISKESYERARESILENGFCFAVHVWKNKGKNYIIDGHQRVFALTQLVEHEGYKCPPLPVALVKAKTFQEAKMKVLAGVSLYGQINELNLEKYLKGNKIDLSKLAAQFEFPNLDITEFMSKFDSIPSEDDLPDADGSNGGLPSSSEGVRQVQLLFDTASHAEFMKYAEALAERYGTENVTDTVLKALHAAYKINLKKS